MVPALTLVTTHGMACDCLCCLFGYGYLSIDRLKQLYREDRAAILVVRSDVY